MNLRMRVVVDIDHIPSSFNQLLTTLLAVSSFGAMLALVMMFTNVGCKSIRGSTQYDGAVSQPGDEFKQVGMFHSGCRGLAPGKGRMAGDQDARHSERVKLSLMKEPGNHQAGVQDIGIFHFAGGQRRGAWDLAVKVIGMRCAKAGDWLASLGPGGGEFRVGVNHAANLRKLPVEQQMGVQIARRIERAFDNRAVKTGNHEVSGLQRVVGDAAWFDGHQRLRTAAINAADVAKGVQRQAPAGDFLVGVQDLFAKFGQEHGRSSWNSVVKKGVAPVCYQEAPICLAASGFAQHLCERMMRACGESLLMGAPGMKPERIAGMDRRNFVKSLALAPLAAGVLNPGMVFGSEANPGLAAPEEARTSQSGTPFRDRFELTLRRVLSGESPAYSEEFVLEDVRPTAGRRFTEYSGDVSGRYIGALATAARVYGINYPNLAPLVDKVIALQKPDGYFGNTFHYDKPTDLDMALLWGNGRLLVGLLEFCRLQPSPAVLAACKRLGDFLVRVGPLMLSKEIRDGFGAQHFASSYICWTQQVEGLANLYQVTQDLRYRRLAEQIVDVTERRAGDHAHGYLTSLRGWMDLYAATSDADLLHKCEARWDDVAQSKDLLITGGVPEGWSPNNHRTEGCAEADWLRLSLALWQATGNPKYLSMAERTAFNELAFNQFASGDFGHHVYTDTGLPAGGAVRAWWCCSLHGLRCFPDIHSAAFQIRSGNLVFALPVDSRIDSPVLSASSVSTLAQDGKVKITILSTGNATLGIRKPEWANGLVILINGGIVNYVTDEGFVKVRRDWQAGDRVDLQYAMALRQEPAGPNRVAFFYGPWLLGAPAAENPAFFNELTTDNRLSTKASASAPPSTSGFAVPVAATTFKFIPAEFPEQPGTVTLRAIAEQAGQPTTSWELRFLTNSQT